MEENDIKIVETPEWLRNMEVDERDCYVNRSIHPTDLVMIDSYGNPVERKTDDK